VTCLKGDRSISTSSKQLHPGAVLAANSVTNALLALNSAVNFAIYCLVGKKFRRILRRRVLRCGKSTATDETTAPVAPESVAPTPTAVGGSRGGFVPAGSTSVTMLRSTTSPQDSDCRKDGAPHNENHVVVVVVSAADEAVTACSSPTTPSADEELTVLPDNFRVTLNNIE